jgi:predicted acyl esterase
MLKEVLIPVRDGTTIGAAVYAPETSGRFPALLAASPYRYDNNVLPAGPQFLWRETGPIEFYVKQGYAYVHMDVRGCGKSGGEFELLGANEQNDLYDVVEWIARQPWSNGKVGGLGQSYFCMSQWWLGIMAPPALACLGAYDGLNDPYRASCYQGGIPGQFFPGYWWNQNRIINRFPANGAAPREQKTDLDALLAAHPTYDEFWRSRSAWERLPEIKVPLYSIGIWGKIDLHTRGNIDGFRRAQGPRKLQMRGPPNAWAANAEFNSVELHEKVLLPFYDLYLKGIKTDYEKRPSVEYFVRGANVFKSAETWPPPGVKYKSWYLSGEKVGSCYLPQRWNAFRHASGWQHLLHVPQSRLGERRGGVRAVRTSHFDPVRRVLTFTTCAAGEGPRDRRPDQAGPLRLLEPQRHRLLRQARRAVSAGECAARDQGLAARLAPRARSRHSTEMEPYHTHANPSRSSRARSPSSRISVEPNAFQFKKGNRIRLELANGDSPVTDVLWTHYYAPSKIGQDTFWHSAKYPSALILPTHE